MSVNPEFDPLERVGKQKTIEKLKVVVVTFTMASRSPRHPRPSSSQQSTQIDPIILKEY
jgi:hypothetical protein